jgi:hypothetical protein
VIERSGPDPLFKCVCGGRIVGLKVRNIVGCTEAQRGFSAYAQMSNYLPQTVGRQKASCFKVNEPDTLSNDTLSFAGSRMHHLASIDLIAQRGLRAQSHIQYVSQ